MKSAMDAQRKYELACNGMEGLMHHHIGIHSGNPRQGTKEWLENKHLSIGGSELASLFGTNPYCSREELLAKKVGLVGRGDPGVACWWGTMFEPVSERLVELDCSSRIAGTDIHVQPWLPMPHANSPDGYCVVTLELQNDEWVLSHDPDGAIRRGIPIRPLLALVELKAPYRRLPDGKVPKYYLPQIWSGIALAPATHIGLFAEVVYRLCSLSDLDHGPEFATNYHASDFRKRNFTRWSGAYGIGLTAIFAPRPGTRGARIKAGEKEKPSTKFAEKDGFKLLMASLQCPLDGPDFGTEIADFGELADRDPKLFELLMKNISQGSFKTVHSDPQFEEFSVDQFCDQARAKFADQEHYYFLGLLPWKIFQADYHFVEKQEEYIYEIRKVVVPFIRQVKRIMEAEDKSLAYFAETQKMAALRGAAPRKKKEVAPEHRMAAIKLALQQIIEPQ